MLSKRKHELDQFRRRAARCLRRHREEAELTQRELAKRMDITHVAVHKIETGLQRVELPLFCRWAKACGSDPVAVLREIVPSADRQGRR